ncbi:MAG: transglycosylase SLT domain-containing protein [Bacteroidetes bacterium]|nr:transglycosylase SLT domain-containing protein [Bacteroidota bacterium]
MKAITEITKYKKHIIASLVLVGLFLAIKLFIYAFSESKDDNSYQQYFNSHYKVFSLGLPKDLNFAGEYVPINDFSVREALDRELLVNTYWQSQTLLLQKRANRWLPIIEPILKKNGIPDDFKYIAIVESGLTNIVSPQKATGYWQIIESTAKVYGLEINEEVDERYNVIKSTEAACKYFKEAYSKFKNWTLVAASYNMGMGGVERQLEKQKVSSYYDLLLNDETSRYVFRIVSVKEIFTRPEAYGFIVRKKHLYSAIPTNEIVVDSSISDLTAFALTNGLTYKVFKIFNPWLRKNSLTNKERKPYKILLPKNEFLTADIDWEYGESDGSSHIAAAVDSAQYTVLSDTINRVIHVVREGETVSSLANKYQVDEQQIKMWNILSENNSLVPNQEIIIFKNRKN